MELGLDGLTSVLLIKPWLEYAIGSEVRVDPLRAAWLRENGYAAVGLEVKPAAPATVSEEEIESGDPDTGDLITAIADRRARTHTRHRAAVPAPIAEAPTPPAIPDTSLPALSSKE